MSRGYFPVEPLSRRQMLRLCCAASASLCLPNPLALARADDLAQRLREAARKRAAVSLPAGDITLAGLDLPDGAILQGVPGRTVLKLSGLGPLLSASMARKITLENLVFDGAGGVTPKEKGLLDFTDVIDLSIRGCVIRRASARGVMLARCGGVFAQNEIAEVGDAGIYSRDGLGVDFDNNHIHRCGDNGLVIHATSAGRYDGSRIRNTLVEDVDNRSGGNGPYGNGVLVWGAGTIRVERNRIYRCAYSAVRNNAGHGVDVIGNDCKGFREKAMYAEFGAKNSVFRDNRIEDAGAGIAVANADQGTDGAIVSGNTIISMKESHPDPEFGPQMLWLTGILAEKNADITGNRIVGPGWIGIALGGWRENLRAEANEISGVDYGVVLATGEGAGDATVARNRISAKKAAVIATAGMTFLPGDLTKSGAKKYPRLILRDNETG
ncbi:TIGR03808 family TAT-translocated repetitive protein [Methylocystis iwaonis]|uniref:TIGR03808 family TAT-translocated repetitive protein n=1 Tax=Methylocystis iwaonis TaxID=2885079 RepID=UPI002E7BFFFD|nr:TIGR03808 family TAT-translocated repetitive protein [Methylocystis iwaonis]